MEPLEKANAILRTDITKLATKVDSKHLKLQQGHRMEKRNFAARARTVARLSGTIQSLHTNGDSLFSETEVLREDRNNAEFIRGGSNAQEALFAAQNRKPAQQLVGVQKRVTTIRTQLSEHRSKLSSEIE